MTQEINGTKVPKRIWLMDLGDGEICWSNDPNPENDPDLVAVEYVRNDRALQSTLPQLNGEVVKLVRRLRSGHEEHRMSLREEAADMIERLAAMPLPAVDGEVERLREALGEIANGCGMLNQPAALNGPEESWLRKRIAEYERVATEALKAPATPKGE